MRPPLAPAWLHGLGRAASALADMLMPPVCAGCKEPAGVTGLLCAPCWSALAPIGAGRCDSCGIPLPQAPDDSGQCGACMATPPLFDTARAPQAYAGTARALVLAFKNGRPELAPLLAGQMVPEAGRLAAHAPLVLPVPLHWSRLFARGYNQSALLSSRIALTLGLEHDIDLLRRIRRTRSSQGLNRAARQRNVAGAFALRAGGDRLVAGRAILLVDDVLTTGATATAVTALLRRKGAARVDVVCFARATRESAAAGSFPVGPGEAP